MERYLGLTIAEWLLAGVGALAALATFIAACMAWRKANQALKVAKEANKLSQTTNGLSREANDIAEKAMKHQAIIDLEIVGDFTARAKRMENGTVELVTPSVYAVVVNLGRRVFLQSVTLEWNDERTGQSGQTMLYSFGTTGHAHAGLEPGQSERYWSAQYEPDGDGYQSFVRGRRLVVTTQCGHQATFDLKESWQERSRRVEASFEEMFRTGQLSEQEIEELVNGKRTPII